MMSSVKPVAADIARQDRRSCWRRAVLRQTDEGVRAVPDDAGIALIRRQSIFISYTKDANGNGHVLQPLFAQVFESDGETAMGFIAHLGR